MTKETTPTVGASPLIDGLVPNGLRETLGNIEWLRANEDKIKDILPETWTHIHNLNGLQMGFKMKLLGIDWRSEDEFGRVMVFFQKTKLMLMDGLLVKRNPHSIFEANANPPTGTI